MINKKKILNVQTDSRLANLRIGDVEMDWTRHALEQAIKKGVQAHTKLILEEGSVVELEYVTSMEVKMVVRIHSTLSPRYDEVFVLIKNKRHNKVRVITCWLNHISDNHSSLNLKRIA
jgi:hypothetical protein